MYFKKRGVKATGNKKKKYLFIRTVIAVCVSLGIFLLLCSGCNANLVVGDYITFGSYEQDNDLLNGKEDIEWLVLAIKGNKAFIISKYALDMQTYNKERKEVTWEVCTLRKWLNDDFYNEAFSFSEQSKIQSVKIVNDDNPEWGTPGGNDTTDKVFLLSIDEAENYFDSFDERICGTTEYAKAKGVITTDDYSNNGKDACVWWLRSPGNNCNDADYVIFGGCVYYGGIIFESSGFGVRPAMWISIDS